MAKGNRKARVEEEEEEEGTYGIGQYLFTISSENQLSPGPIHHFRWSMGYGFDGDTGTLQLKASSQKWL